MLAKHRASAREFNTSTSHSRISRAFSDGISTEELFALVSPPVGIYNTTVPLVLVLSAAILACISLIVLIVHWRMARFDRPRRADIESAHRISGTHDYVETRPNDFYKTGGIAGPPRVHRPTPVRNLSTSLGDSDSSYDENASIGSEFDDDAQSVRPTDIGGLGGRWWSRNLDDDDTSYSLGNTAVATMRGSAQLSLADEHGALTPIQRKRPSSAATRTSVGTTATGVSGLSESSEKTITQAGYKSGANTTAATVIGDDTANKKSTPTPASDNRSAPQSSSRGGIISSLSGSFLSALHLSFPSISLRRSNAAATQPETEITTERPTSVSLPPLARQQSMPTVWEFEENGDSACATWQLSPVIGEQDQHDVASRAAGCKDDEAAEGDETARSSSDFTTSSGLTQIVLVDLMEARGQMQEEES